MALVCYLDDSGTNPQDKIVALAGFIGTIDSWAAFEVDAQRIMDEYGVTYIRGMDIYQNDGEYKNWTIDKKCEFISRLNQALVPNVGLVISCSTLRANYSERAKGRPQIQSSFGFCFEMLFHLLIKDEGFRSAVSEPRVDLSFIIEDGNSHNDEVFQRYERLKQNHGSDLPFFAGMSFVKKRSSIAIQMADLCVFLTRRHAEAMEKNGRQPTERHRYLDALLSGIRPVGRVSTDFGYLD